jgi:hypothetical protein
MSIYRHQKNQERERLFLDLRLRKPQLRVSAIARKRKTSKNFSRRDREPIYIERSQEIMVVKFISGVVADQGRHLADDSGKLRESCCILSFLH